MIKYSELRDTQEYSKVSYLSQEEVKWLWINDYFDGPLEGMVEVDSEMFLCKLAEEVEEEAAENWFRKYWIIKLTPDQLDTELYWHEEFCKYVGEHFVCSEDGSRKTAGAKHPRVEWDKFYKPYKENYKPDFTNNEVIGWCKL